MKSFSPVIFIIHQGQQYVCAGELIALQTMTNVLNYLKLQKIDIAKVWHFLCRERQYSHLQYY